MSRSSLGHYSLAYKLGDCTLIVGTGWHGEGDDHRMSSQTLSRTSTDIRHKLGDEHHNRGILPVDQKPKIRYTFNRSIPSELAKMLHVQAVRSILYAYISSLEEDMREIILYDLDHTEDVWELFSEQRIAELKAEGTDIGNLAEVVVNLNFAEPWQILSARSNKLDSTLNTIVKKHFSKIPLFVKLRNQVMHSRPLDAELMSGFYSFIDDAVSTPASYFKTLKRTVQALSMDPSSAVTVQIEFDKSNDRISNNLPIPDFDETGLIGRESELNDLGDLVSGPWPIITLVGEGAIGKTSLALRLAYKILDDTAYDFDSIIWVSAKANQLLPNDIKDLKNSIRNSLDLLDEVGSHLGAGKVSDGKLTDLIEYLNTFKILLIIDNLETVIDEDMKEFLRSFNSRDSKIIITSRVGLGDFERRYPVMNLDERDAVKLLRSLADNRKVKHLTRCDNIQLLKYCSRMLNSPGFIKWFVSLVSLGASPERALADPKIFLEFALENVIHYIKEDSLFVIQCMSNSAGDKSLAEISYLTSFEGDKLRNIILELCAANLIFLNTKHVQGDIISSYSLSSLARFYINNKFKLDPEKISEIRKKSKEIAFERDSVLSKINNSPVSKYLKETISYRSQEDAVVGKLLKDAFNLSRNGLFEDAKEKIENAKQLSPNFHEVYRVSGIINYFAGDFAQAEDDYEIAISIAPSDPVTLYWYAGFQLRALNDTRSAIELLRRALTQDPDAIAINTELSRALTFIECFDEARELVRRIVKRSDLSLKQIRIAADGLLQTYSREIQKYIGLNLGVNACNLIIDAADVVSNLPDRALDIKVRQRIGEIYDHSRTTHHLIFNDKRKSSLTMASEILSGKMIEILNSSMGFPSKNDPLEIENAYPEQTDRNSEFDIGICKFVSYDGNYGFLLDQSKSQDYYFNLKKFKNIRPGQIVKYMLIAKNDRSSAKIIDVYENNSLIGPYTAKLVSCRDNTYEYDLLDGTIYKSFTNDFYLYGIMPERMIGEFVEISLFEVPNSSQKIICDVKVSEEQQRAYSIFSQIESNKTYYGSVRKPISDKGGGEIYVDHLNASFTFNYRCIRRPFSREALTIEASVNFKLKRDGTSLVLDEIEPVGVGMPELGKLYVAKIRSTPEKGDTYTFVTIESRWEGIVLKSDLNDPKLWDQFVSGREVICNIVAGREENSVKAVNVVMNTKGWR